MWLLWRADGRSRGTAVQRLLEMADNGVTLHSVIDAPVKWLPMKLRPKGLRLFSNKSIQGADPTCAESG